MSLPILVDCDEVICDFVPAVLELALREAGIGKRYDEITQWDLGKAIGWSGCDAAVTDAIKRKEFCARLKPIPEGLTWLRAVEAEFGADRVFVCTASWSPEWMGQRAWWLEKHGVPLARQIHTKAKYLVPGYLIDDAEQHIERRAKDQGFLIARPWNKAGGVQPRGDYAAAMAWLRAVAR